MDQLTKTDENERVESVGSSAKTAVFNFCLDDNPLCWRCGQPDSEHSYFQGVTYCLPNQDEDTGDPIYDREIQLDPPELSDEELIRRFSFLRDVRDWEAV